MAAIQFIDTARIESAIPNLFTGEVHPKLSSRYTPCNPKVVFDRLADHGMRPVGFRTMRYNNFGRYSIDFGTQEAVDRCREVGASFPLVTLDNSADGSSALLLNLGIFTVACSNTARFQSGGERIKLRHVGLTDDTVDVMAEKAIERSLSTHSVYRSWAEKMLPIEETRRASEFAANRLAEKFGVELQSHRELLRPRFKSEFALEGYRSVKQVFDSMQGNLRNGGIRLKSWRFTKPITSIVRQNEYDEICFQAANLLIESN